MYFVFYQPVINAPLIREEVEEYKDTMNATHEQHNPVEDEHSATDYHDCSHNSDDI